ncbi:MAG: hypothetical protein D6B27_07525 [Gammaproteobacteria bacterium]|nr:MAG: hypothetical protein D6B27_07525 [Gammaproteobacteria bacterium]
MKIHEHAARTKKLYGVKGVDIHKWVDQYFNKWRFWLVLITENRSFYNPYTHRHHLHYKEALPLAIEKFKHKYSEDIIEKVLFQHIRDDYHGYLPSKSDFNDPEFLDKYHRW